MLCTTVQLGRVLCPSPGAPILKCARGWPGRAPEPAAEGPWSKTTSAHRRLELLLARKSSASLSLLHTGGAVSEGLRGAPEAFNAGSQAALRTGACTGSAMACEPDMFVWAALQRPT